MNSIFKEVNFNDTFFLNCRTSQSFSYSLDVIISTRSLS